uniref:cytochrome c oxidase subunit II n=1 Tax=Ceratina smaragdula TaxID=710033 RepID=UPI00207A95B5|nr:cytochrome c oxidase subunit II [Ceratina smaragdula]URX52618.1 cytochrome c oxidase subunit 2 [Ceratina smaragdula]
MATWQMMFFQDSNSPYSDNLISFHNLTMMMMVSIIILILLIMIDLLINSFTNRFLLKNHMIEIMWTIIPMFILLIICFPSLKILYYIDEILNPYFTIKAIGHQWYWSYEYSEFKFIEFDSYMINLINSLDQFRLLDVDNRMIIPFNFSIRIITSSMDVIHSWTIPSLGIKMDSIPGRINQSNLFTFRPGLYFGQCSEICGMNHSFMPIVLESTNYKNFLNWMNKM